MLASLVLAYSGFVLCFAAGPTYSIVTLCISSCKVQFGRVVLQAALLKEGCYCGEMDEDDFFFGSGTQNAVLTFQSIKGVPETGFADEATWKALGVVGGSSNGAGEPSLECQLSSSVILPLTFFATKNGYRKEQHLFRSQIMPGTPAANSNLAKGHIESSNYAPCLLCSTLTQLATNA